MNLRHEVSGQKFVYLREQFSVTDLNGGSIGEGSYGPVIVHRYDSSTKLTIGKFCSFAQDSRILLGGEHRMDWASQFPFSVLAYEGAGIAGHPGSRGDIEIGSDVWVGFGAVILSGTTINDGAVIGAGAVVSGYVAPYAIVAGNPGKVIRRRFPDSMVADLLDIKWWDWPQERLTKALPDLLSPNVGRFLERVRTKKI